MVVFISSSEGDSPVYKIHLPTCRDPWPGLDGFDSTGHSVEVFLIVASYQFIQGSVLDMQFLFYIFNHHCRLCLPHPNPFIPTEVCLNSSFSPATQSYVKSFNISVSISLLVNG